MWHRTILLLLLAAVTVRVAVGQTAGNAESPMHLILWYRADSLSGSQFREHLERDGTIRFDRWQRGGIFRDYRILSSSTFSDSSWDAMVILTFDRFADLEGWMKIEQEFPGGLDSTELRLGRPVGTYLCDLPFHGEDSAATNDESVFLVKPYEYEEKGTYMLFGAAYVAPQFDAWLRYRTLRSYGIYTNRNPTGSAWDVLVLLEYRSVRTLEDRDAIKDRTGTELRANAGWDLLDRIKLTLRGSDEERLVAGQIAP